MSDAGFATPQIQQVGPNSYAVSHGNDRGLYVEFFMKQVLLEFESNRQGRQLYKDVPHIKIITPGGKSEIIRAVKMESDPAGPSDLERFPHQWKAFENKQIQVQTGTPLEMWARLSGSKVMEFKSQNVHTVEQLSELPDSVLHNFGMDGRRIRDDAKVFIGKAEQGAALSSANARIEQLENEIAGLKAAYASMATEEPPKPKRGPGRPRKEQDNGNQE